MSDTTKRIVDLCLAKLDEEPEGRGENGFWQGGAQDFAQEVLRALGIDPPEPRQPKWARERFG